MLATFLIVFREVIEAGLIVGIVFAATRGVPGRGLWISYGIVSGLAGAELAQSLSQAIDRAAAPVEISSEVVDGYADDELARLSGDVDLLVCGSRGHSPLGSMMLGSVSAGVLRKARSPVLVAPRGARDGFTTLRARTTAAA